MRYLFGKILGVTLLWVLTLCLTSCDSSSSDPTTDPTTDSTTDPASSSNSMQSVPLTLEAKTAGTIKVWGEREAMRYSKNGGAKVELPSGTVEIEVSVGDKVEFYGYWGKQKRDLGIIPDDMLHFVFREGTADCYIYGNIMSLYDEDKFATDDIISMGDINEYIFLDLFYHNDKIYNHPTKDILLPATKLARGCYERMFSGCKNLTKAPELPATTLALRCYKRMFSGCTSLTNAYVKAAYTSYGSECFGMFDGCTATGAVLHTTAANKGSWSTAITSKGWSTWTANGDWN